MLILNLAARLGGRKLLGMPVVGVMLARLTAGPFGHEISLASRFLFDFLCPEPVAFPKKRPTTGAVMEGNGSETLETCSILRLYV